MLNNELSRITWVLKHFSQYALEGNMEKYLADASVFLEMMSYTVIGWQWLKMALKASEQLALGVLLLTKKHFMRVKFTPVNFTLNMKCPMLQLVR